MRSYLLAIPARLILRDSHSEFLIELSPSIQVGPKKPFIILSHCSERSSSVEEIKFLIIFFAAGISPHFLDNDLGIRLLALVASAINVLELLAAFKEFVFVHYLLLSLVSLIESDLRVLRVVERKLLFNFILIVLFKL